MGAVVAADHREILGVNDRVQLAEARRILNERLLERWMRAGVTVVDPATTWLGCPGHGSEPDAVILPDTQLQGATRIASGAEVGPNCTLRDTVVGRGRHRGQRHVSERGGRPAGDGRPVHVPASGHEASARKAKAGGYVEMKNAVIGEGSKVPHLSATSGTRPSVRARTSAPPPSS